MLTHDKILEMEVTLSELEDLNEVLKVNLEAYTDMQAKGFGCSYISNLMQEKIEKIKELF